MVSIKKKLSSYLSISISLLLITIFLVTDISVDNWISNEFDRSMINKASFLETLISENHNGIEFDFADEFMPEFSGVNNPEYFQLWVDGKVFERSKTLALFDVHDLPQLNTSKKHKKVFQNTTLPDGRSGRMYFVKFTPQIHSHDRESLGVSVDEFVQTQKPMTLAYAISNEGLNQILWLVDIIFVLTSVLTVIAIKTLVSQVVDRGLSPLDQLNKELKEFTLNSASSALPTQKLPEELIPIAQGINHFISENKILYAREKRITSDIAHELKTPIAELLNLSEVAIKFPHEKQLSDTYKTDVLAIAERLRSIVNGILLLQKSTSDFELKKQNVDLKNLLQLIIKRETKDNRHVEFSYNRASEFVNTNDIAIDTVLSNLVNNALFYSPNNTPVFISVTTEPVTNRAVIEISNISSHQYSESDLAQFFEPLWQKDSSRTASDRYGLGLAIVKSYCDKIDALLSVNMKTDGRIIFTIIL